MKKIFFVIIGFLLFITSCKSSEKLYTAEEGFNYVKSLKNYVSDIRVTFKNSRNEESIFLRQYSSSNNLYRLDFEGERSYIYRDDKIYVKDIKNGANYYLDKEFDEVYRFTFINEYIKLLYSMDEVEYFQEEYNYEEGKDVYFGAKVNFPINNLNICEGILYLDSKTLLPKKLLIYDSEGNERVLIDYISFDILEEIDETLFNF